MYWVFLPCCLSTAQSLERHFFKPVAIKTKLKTGVSIQANKLDLAASHIAPLQYRMAICAFVSITVTATIIALWLKELKN